MATNAGSTDVSVRMATFVPPATRDRFRRRADDTGVSLAAYLRIVLSRVDREMQEEEQ